MKNSRELRIRIAEVVLLIIALASTGVLVTNALDPNRSMMAIFCAGMLFTLCLVIEIRLWIDPDRIRARQSADMLELAGATFRATSEGLNATSAQQICDMLLPASRCIAVAITDTEVILGYAGVDKDLNDSGDPIRTAATHEVLDNGRVRIMTKSKDIGFPEDRHKIRAAIIVPIKLSNKTVGTLKFYYPRARMVNETQQSIAVGFGQLLSTQIAANALDQQRKLATSMELKALQTQINPHFLFNTINTIASFVRTDPVKARELLREFATFYRSTLEDASDLISLQREVAQTTRYLTFEVARFGADRLKLHTLIPDNLQQVLVPAFMVQPLVENSVRHAMPMEGKLTIEIVARAHGNDLVLDIKDDGIGMAEEQRQNILNAKSEEGLGIAVRNINERILGYYGPESYMKVESELGRGTVVTLFLRNGLATVRQEEQGGPAETE